MLQVWQLSIRENNSLNYDMCDSMNNRLTFCEHPTDLPPTSLWHTNRPIPNITGNRLSACYLLLHYFAWGLVICMRENVPFYCKGQPYETSGDLTLNDETSFEPET